MTAALDLQTEMHRLVKEAWERTTALLNNYRSACQTINDQMPEITIALHERVERYIKELQIKLDETEDRNKLEVKVESAHKWMESIKAMEALASFSRRKIRNLDRVKDPRIQMRKTNRIRHLHSDNRLRCLVRATVCGHILMHPPPSPNLLNLCPASVCARAFRGVCV